MQQWASNLAASPREIDTGGAKWQFVFISSSRKGFGQLLSSSPGRQERFRKRRALDWQAEVIGTEAPIEKSRTSLEGPFGEVLRATGPMARVNPLRFSTKYQDEETDQLYYGFRYYSASVGRWLSRDPILEWAFQFTLRSKSRAVARNKVSRREEGDLYAFLRQSPVNDIDLLGLDVYKLRSNDGSTCQPCRVQHRIVIGDSGTNSGWSYKIHVRGVTGTVCGCIPRMVGTSSIEVVPQRGSAADVVAEYKRLGSVEMRHVKTNADVDELLNEFAYSLAEHEWYYFFILRDCGTFGSLWLDLAEALQNGGDSVSISDEIVNGGP